MLKTKSIVAKSTALMDLPIVNWEAIGATAPERIEFNYEGSEAELPSADCVVITWTSAEWSALDHVFRNSEYPRNSKDTYWRDDWHLYSKNAPESSAPHLWGYFSLVKIKNNKGKETKVLLFKSESHLAHPPYIDGLSDMVKNIIADVSPSQVYTIGTAGGSTLEESLGDVVVTNAGHIQLEKPENIHASYNNKTVSCNWYPSLFKQDGVQEELFLPLNDVLSQNELNHLITELHDSVSGSSAFSLADLVNNPLKPNNIKSPKVLLKKNVPLLTTDYYFIANGNNAEEYSVLEMDDTVVGHEAALQGVDFCFVRNISDPIVASTAVNGTIIPDNVRKQWSSLIYETCGFYTSFNGALTTWAAIVG